MQNISGQYGKVISGPIRFEKENRVNKKTEDGRGFTTVTDGTLCADVWVTVDLESICRQLAYKAIKNKNRQSRYMSGDVIVEAKNVEVRR